MKEKINIEGRIFERLTVIERVPNYKDYHAILYKCLCSCGNEFIANKGGLLNNSIKSCGCYNKERITKHGMSDTLIYKRWRGMISRCSNPNDQAFEYYGGRGITVSDSWLSFDNFYEDMGDSFKEELEIDRLDNSKGYCKANCKWVSSSDNQYNRRIQSNNTSGRTGVHKVKRTGKYLAWIKQNSIMTNLGTFDTFDEAVKCREEAEMKYYGYNKE